MTNPNNAIGTNAAYSGRTSANAFNDVLSVLSRGIVSGWACAPDSGMSVVLGGDGSTRDVAIAEDNIGNRTTINNISGTPVSVTIGTAPLANSRIDLIVAYVDNPPEGTSTIADNYEACGLIVVQGTASASPTEPDDSDIRTAITTDGGSGVNAYYVILAQVTVANGTTNIDPTMITQGVNAGIDNANIQDGAITYSKLADKAANTAIITDNNLSPSDDSMGAWETLLGSSGYYVTYYNSASQFTNQPTTYGILETMYRRANHALYQRWYTFTGGPSYHRAANVNGWWNSTVAPGVFRPSDDDFYSTNERAAGTWIDGRTIYKKTIEWGTMPNNDREDKTGQYPKNSLIVKIEAFAVNKTTKAMHMIPYTSFSTPVTFDTVFAGTPDYGTLSVATTSDRTGWDAYITLYYCKP